MGKKTKSNEAMVEKPSHKASIPVHGLYGLVLLLVAASVMYANYRVYFGVEELVARIMLIPSTIAVAVFLVYKATR